MPVAQFEVGASQKDERVGFDNRRWALAGDRQRATIILNAFLNIALTAVDIADIVQDAAFAKVVIKRRKSG